MKNVVVETVAYGMTTKNGDDYEKCHMEGSVVGGNVTAAVNELKEAVSETLRVEIPLNDFAGEYHDPEPETEAEEVEPPKKEEKKSNQRQTRKSKAQGKCEELGIKYSKRDNADALEALIEEHGAEPEEPKKKSKKGKSVKEKVEDLETQTYDRTIDEHMDKLGDLLDEEWPAWEDHLETVKKHISMKLVGVPFLNGKGKVLKSFMEALDDKITVALEKIEAS